MQQTLCAWFEQNARDLPWRRRPTAYRVWVSEIMLQQTRVEAVREKYVAFVRRFATVRTLAAADIDDVLQAWSGLGYYRRARMLHAAAQRIAAAHSRIPRDSGALRELPGIGRYTAGAIASIAFNEPAPIVDGNIERVFARLHRIAKPAHAQLWQLATEWVEQGAALGLKPRVLNQSIMELGATICTPRNPACARCPVNHSCKAHAAGNAASYPATKPPRKKKVVRYLMLAISDGSGRILLRRREQADHTSLLPADLWELPHAQWLTRKPHAKLRAIAGVYAPKGRAKLVRHSITDVNVQLVVQAACATAAPRSDCRWFTPEQARGLAIASATRKALDAIGETRPVVLSR